MKIAGHPLDKKPALAHFLTTVVTVMQLSDDNRNYLEYSGSFSERRFDIFRTVRAWLDEIELVVIKK